MDREYGVRKNSRERHRYLFKRSRNITKTTEKIIICGIICLGGIFMYNEDKESRRNKSKENDGLLSKFFRKRTKRLLTDLDKLFRKIMWIEIAISVVLILTGVVFLIWPSISVQVLSILFGIVILASGIMNIYGYMKRKSFPIFKFHLVYGILRVILGILTIINPFTFNQVVTIFIGVWMLYLAVVKIDLSLRLKTIGESSWSLLLVSAILEIFMSILIFINPFSNLVITQVAGAYFILSGILNCTDAVLTKNRAIDFMDNF